MFIVCNFDVFTDSQLDSLDDIGTIMEAPVNELWSLKQGIMYKKPRETQISELYLLI